MTTEFSKYSKDTTNPPSPDEMLPKIVTATWFRDSEKSIAFIALWGEGRTVKNMKSETFYEVTSGYGRFFFPELAIPPQNVDVNNPLPVFPNTVYRSQASRVNEPLMMLATSTPPFDRDFEIEIS